MKDLLRERIRNFLAVDEDVRQFVYDDKTGKPIKKGSVVLGNPTIGIGRRLDSPKGISMNAVMFLLGEDLDEAFYAAQGFDWFLGLSEARKCVVIMMIFQLGITGFKEFKKMIRAIDNGCFAVAAAEMLKSDWAEECPGRSKRLASMMLNGE